MSLWGNQNVHYSLKFKHCAVKIMLNDKQIKVIEPVKNIMSLKIFIDGRSDAPQFHFKFSIQIED